MQRVISVTRFQLLRYLRFYPHSPFFFFFFFFDLNSLYIFLEEKFYDFYKTANDHFKYVKNLFLLSLSLSLFFSSCDRNTRVLLFVTGPLSINLFNMGKTTERTPCDN